MKMFVFVLTLVATGILCMLISALIRRYIQYYRIPKAFEFRKKVIEMLNRAERKWYYSIPEEERRSSSHKFPYAYLLEKIDVDKLIKSSKPLIPECWFNFDELLILHGRAIAKWQDVQPLIDQCEQEYQEYLKQKTNEDNTHLGNAEP